MYGLIVENLSQYVVNVYGREKWNEIRRMADLRCSTFSTHRVYADSLIPRLTTAACQVLGVTERDFLESMGIFFISFVGHYGYDRMLSVLGRHMRDFLNGLDNLHEYLKFSYPLMNAPSFFCERETSTGLILHYRSVRQGFLWYTIGQIKEVGRHFYQTAVDVHVLQQESSVSSLHVIMQLSFDNRAFHAEQGHNFLRIDRVMLPVKAFLFLEIFPFCLVFDDLLTIKTIGKSLKAIMPDITGRKLSEVFDLTRPLIQCTWEAILLHSNNVFELCSVRPIHSHDSNANQLIAQHNEADDDVSMEDRLLHLKGQMMFMEEWKSMAYLGTPVMRDLDAMIHTGLYINDLSMHDFSRDMVLAGQQQSAELKLALDQELQKSRQLEESMRKLDVEMKRTDELLYQMIPKQVADRLRRGEAAVETCQFFDCVTVLFSDVVTFTEICSRIAPMEVVSMLNCMYSLFDQLTEEHQVYKVETIGDAYMVVAGAPVPQMGHAEKVCRMALDMVEVIGGLKDPSTGHSLKIRVGIHSGAVVAGVVGLKMPRYCLFGDTVNTASRMESTSKALKIHISEETTKRLTAEQWDIEERGTIAVKGKGLMKTYWLNGHKCTTKAKGSNTTSLSLQKEIHPIYSPVSFGGQRSRSLSLTHTSPEISLLTSIPFPGTRTKESQSVGCQTVPDIRPQRVKLSSNASWEEPPTATYQCTCCRHQCQGTRHVGYPLRSLKGVKSKSFKKAVKRILVIPKSNDRQTPAIAPKTYPCVLL